MQHPVVIAGVSLTALGMCLSAYMLGHKADGGSAKPGTRGETTSAEGAPDFAVEQARLRNELDSLKTQVSVLGRSHSPVKSAAQDVQAGQSQHASPRLERDPARQAEEWHAHMRDVESRFDNESINGQWATTTASTIEQVLSSSGDSKSAAYQVQCKTTMCRVSIQDDGAGSGERAVRPLLRDWPGLPSVEVDRTNDDGVAHIAVYLSPANVPPSQRTP